MSFILVSSSWDLPSAASCLGIVIKCVCEVLPWWRSPSSLPVWRYLSMICCLLPQHEGNFFSFLNSDMLVEILELKLIETWPLRLALLRPSSNHIRLCRTYSTPVIEFEAPVPIYPVWGQWHNIWPHFSAGSKKVCWFPNWTFFLCGCRSVVFQISYMSDQKP